MTKPSVPCLIPGDKKSVICNHGFSCFLDIDCSGVPSRFSQWIADHIDVNSNDIVLEGGCINLSVDSFCQVTGLNNSGDPVNVESVGVKEAFTSFLGLSEFPTIKQLGELLLQDVLSDDQYFVCFMAVVFASFLCPNSSTYPSTKYLGWLLVPSQVRNYNWALFGFNWFMLSVKKYLKDKPKVLSSKSNLTLGGCTYYQAVMYLDFVDFGVRSPCGYFPRLNVWRKDMIKEFAQYDWKQGPEYGRRNVLKDIYMMADMFASSIEPLTSVRAGEFVISVLNRVKAAAEMLDDPQFSESGAPLPADFTDSMAAQESPGNAKPARTSECILNDGGVQLDGCCNSDKTEKVDDPDAIPDLNNFANSECTTVVVNSDCTNSYDIGMFMLSPDCTPEVQITGERSFADRCNQLSNEGDVLYNSFGNSTSNNFQSASSSAHKKNLYAPRRHVAPSHFKLSPFEDDRLKSHTRPHQVKYHSTIVCLSEDATVQYNKAIDYVRVYVTIWSLGNSFKFGGRVDFYTMNGFCRKLSLDTPATKCKKNFFFSTMAKTMKKSFDSARKFITKCDLVFMPCLHRVHWFVFAVDFPGECFIVLDSYFREGSDYHNSIKNRLMQNFSKVWNEETDKQVDFSTFRFEHPIVPMQSNTDGCGIFCMKFMQLFNPRSHLKDKFTFRDINNFRIQICNEMLFSHHNLLSM
ncbi:hypothetical protein BRADI_1g46086v3 [Brachypodium distachyon]|uniref:Ubiquitin-like protease family profile domain-containing protein n=1 Tax=Brachypodium distachyon TaxID=15368 RepID=A0A0Q3L781_BRADI|nr:hypothetical protein BRADI_1g46086v3 [Brachypodium distachyon]